MIQFADEAVIKVLSGKGGNGCASFRREKYIPNGGPNGGDGGRGGNVIFMVKRNLRTLAHLRFHPIFKAQNGGDGQGWNRHGRDGNDVIVALPPGTTVRDNETNEILYDFTEADDGKEILFLTGGNGGWGNVHFKSSTNQAPRQANKGLPGEERELKVELSIMADVGLVGFPNAGKSSLLTYFTNARPKIAPYPFTTMIPHLGVLHVDQDRDIIIADIPGIIEGASEGAGLGSRFLKHISRTAGLLFMIDVNDPKAHSAYDTLCNELEKFGADLQSKERIVLLNKIDEENGAFVAAEIQAELEKKHPGLKVIPVSVMTRANMDEAQKQIVALVQKMDRLRTPGKSTEVVAEQKSEFMKTRSVDESMEIQYPGMDTSKEE